MKIIASEVRNWQYFISWDNPVPSDSRTMHAALAALGKLTQLQTKTSVALAPRPSTTWRDVREAITDNLSPTKGNAFYVSLRSGKGFQIGKKTKYAWKKIP